MIYAENKSKISRPAPAHFNYSVNLITLWASLKQQAQKRL